MRLSGFFLVDSAVTGAEQNAYGRIEIRDSRHLEKTKHFMDCVLGGVS